jgi:predicted Zn-dependent protease
VPSRDRPAPPEQRAAELREARQKLYRLFWETCHPEAAFAYNRYAEIMATSIDPELRDPPMAVRMARKAVELEPRRYEPWINLGKALYRGGDWNGAVEALQKSSEIKESGNAPFFLAMAHWQLGDKEKARQYFRKAVEWVDENEPKDEDLRRHRAEAAGLLGVKDESPGKQD